PNTSSPGRNRVALLPTDSTIPAMSVPGIGSLGLKTPAPINRRTYGRPLTTCQTSGWTEAARTRTRTSSSPTVDFPELQVIRRSILLLDNRLHCRSRPSNGAALSGNAGRHRRERPSGMGEHEADVAEPRK